MATVIKNVGPDTVNAHGWHIQRGYVFLVEAESEESWDCSILSPDDEVIENRRYGYHGGDVPPCGADYLYAADDGSELLVIASESDPEQIDTVDGFRLLRVDLEEGEYRSDGNWEFRVLSVSLDGETILAGSC